MKYNFKYLLFIYLFTIGIWRWENNLRVCCRANAIFFSSNSVWFLFLSTEEAYVSQYSLEIVCRHITGFWQWNVSRSFGSGHDLLRVFYYTYFPSTMASKATLYKDNAIKWKMPGFQVLTWKKCCLINMKQKLITLSYWVFDSFTKVCSDYWQVRGLAPGK